MILWFLTQLREQGLNAWITIGHRRDDIQLKLRVLQNQLLL